MATHFTGTDVDGIQLANIGDLWINQANTFVVNQLDAFQFGTTTDNRLLVFGAIASEDGDGISSDGGSFNCSIEIQQGGTVTGFSDGIELEDTAHEVINHGVVNGMGDSGIETRGELQMGSCTVTNFGEVYGRSEGVSMLGGANTLHNSGTITGGTRGVEMFGAADCEIFNTGTISSETGVVLSGFDADSSSRLVNSGTIMGGGLAVSGSFAVELVTNSGTFAGNVALFGGNDVLRNSGNIEGDVVLGDGDDTYRTFGTGYAQSVSGESGNDTLVGGDSADEMSGGENNDLLRGHAGDDRLTGDSGIDSLLGGAGDDELAAGDQSDLLNGGVGNDALDGGRGDDTMIGGHGDDIMVGGAQDDLYVFRPNFGDDVVTDFKDNGADVIQLSRNLFVNFADLTQTADGDGMVQQGTDVLIYAADGSSILLQGTQVASLVAADFLFG
jgi:Ca2+-binding RTX toxin-like protein